jgi:hypothetical protein
VTLGVVVSCYRQEHWLPRTLAGVERALAGAEWSGVLELAARGAEPLPAPGPRWRVLRDFDEQGRPRHALTPGAGRMAGLAVCPGEWVLFLDSDIELEPAWTRAALALAAREPALAAVGGRLDEWYETTTGGRPGRADMHGVGPVDRDVDHLAGLALYRRAALLEAGGYDPRLRSDEDFELGLRLGRRGLRLRALALTAGRHWSGPRPSFGELGRRWETGLCHGAGQVLRLYRGRPGFARLLRRQAHYLVTLGVWLLGLAALALAAALGDPRPFAAWACLPLAGLLFMTARKRSLRLALFSLVTWTQGAAGVLAGWWAMPPGPPLDGAAAGTAPAAPPRDREAAC